MQNTPVQAAPVVAVSRFVAVLALVAVLPDGIAAQSDRLERHRVPAEFMSFRGAEWLERSERVDEEQPERVLDAMGVGPGDVVADIGCGSGYYARRLARRVQPGGRVYCEDIQPEMLEIMAGRAEAEGLTGIEAVLGTATDPRLPDGAIDWVIIADVYHEMSEPEAMLDAIRRALSPRGRVALLEYRVEDGTGDSIKADHTMSVRQVLAEWQAAGFELEMLHDFLPSQHLFVFRATGGAFPSAPLDDHDLFEALQRGVVEAEAFGYDERAVTVRIRRAPGLDEPVVVTTEVGTRFSAGDEAREMVARRDGWVVLEDDGWQEWRLRAIGRHPERPVPDRDDGLEILAPSTAPRVADVLYQAQVGTYTVANSPTLYIPTTHGVEQAALWIADADLGYEEMAPRVEDERMPAVYAVAFGLVLVDRAQLDVTTRQVWADRTRVFERLRDQGLTVWYQLMTGSR